MSEMDRNPDATASTDTASTDTGSSDAGLDSGSTDTASTDAASTDTGSTSTASTNTGSTNTDEKLEIIHHEADKYGHYQLLADGTRIGELTYLHTGENRVLVNHTFVDPSRRGQGLARRLVDRVVADMRETEGKISPSCIYVRRVFENDPQEFADVWDR